MVIDFSWSIEDWMDVIRRFIAIIKNFFAEIGITLFPEDETVAEETTVGE